MLQNMDSIEASCIIYVKVGNVNHPERSHIRLVTVNTAGIVRLTIQHDMNVSVSFMSYPRNFLTQTSADILFLKEGLIYI